MNLGLPLHVVKAVDPIVSGGGTVVWSGCQSLTDFEHGLVSNDTDSLEKLTQFSGIINMIMQAVRQMALRAKPGDEEYVAQICQYVISTSQDMYQQGVNGLRDSTIRIIDKPKPTHPPPSSRP